MKAIRFTISFLISLLILCGAAFGILYATGQFEKNAPFTVSYRGQTLESGKAIGYVKPGAEFETSIPFADYTVKISPLPNDSIRFEANGFPFTWNDLLQEDFSKSFTIAPSEKGFFLSYGNISEIIGKALGAKVTVEEMSEQELFSLTVSNDVYTYVVPFSVNDAPVSGVRLNQKEIVL